MLKIIATIDPTVDQITVTGGRADKLFGQLKVVAVATDETESWIIALYKRFNPAGRSEAGIYYSAWGATIEDNPSEILRIFSTKPKVPYRLAKEYFAQLVEEHSLHNVPIVRNVS